MTTNTTVAPPGDNAPLKDGLSLRGVTKRFGTLTANDHIDHILAVGEHLRSPLRHDGIGEAETRQKAGLQVSGVQRPAEEPSPVRTTGSYPSLGKCCVNFAGLCAPAPPTGGK